MRHALRHPASGAAAVDTAVFALTPGSGNLLEFSLSKFSLFNRPQRDAVRAFLEAMADWVTRGSAAVLARRGRARG